MGKQFVLETAYQSGVEPFYTFNTFVELTKFAESLAFGWADQVGPIGWTHNKKLDTWHGFINGKQMFFVSSKNVESPKEPSDAQHPLRQAAIYIIEEVIEPLLPNKDGLEGEDYYSCEDQIVAIIEKCIERDKWELTQKNKIAENLFVDKYE